MSTGIDQELKAAFETASDFVQPPAGLAERARTATHTRRRRLAVTIAAVTAFALVAGGGGYLLAKSREPASGANHDRLRHVITVPWTYQVQQLAVNGSYLYVLTVVQDGPPYGLSAYNRVTGKLIRRVGIPAEPSAMAVGPGGLVWLAFYPDQWGGPTAIRLLSPDLRMYSTATGIQTSVIVPTGPTTAIVPTQYGLLAVHMPLPGQPGRASRHLERGTGVGPGKNTAPGVWAGPLDGQVVAQVTNGYGFDSRLVIAGQPGRTFGGAPQHQVGAVASTGSSLWVELFAVKDNNAAQSGPLVRLDTQLRATTPAAIQRSSVFAKTENVWSNGDTVWVATAARGHALVCFASGTQPGPVLTVRATGSVAALAATADTVYVTTTPQSTYDNFNVVSYPVPAACR